MKAAAARRAAPLLLALVALVSCEKETLRAARTEFQSIMGRNVEPAAQAAELESFVARYPEPKTNPYLVRACSILAEYHSRGGQPDIAASWYERAVRATPNDPDLLNALGYLYAAHGMNLDRAVSVLESAVRLAEERGLPRRRQGFIKDSLGWAYRMRGDLPLAVALLEEADRLAPDVSIVREHLADAYRAIGEREKATAILLDLYLQGRATDARLRKTLTEIGQEAGPALARELDRRIALGREELDRADARQSASEGGALVRIRAADGLRLSATLFLPSAGSPRGARPEPCAGVLLLHALGSSRHAAAPLARALAARGLAAMALDLRGHGSSLSETLPGPHVFTERLADNLKIAEQDAREALALLASNPRVDRDRLAAIGAGMGALLAARVLAAAAPRRAGALVMLSPWGRAEAYAEPLATLTPASVLIVAGPDEAAPASTARSLENALGAAPHAPLLLGGGGNGFDLATPEGPVAGRVASFLAGSLLGGAATAPTTPRRSAPGPRAVPRS
jgi:dienelactone hydrolase/Flp pilus assembly protein TadD